MHHQKHQGIIRRTERGTRAVAALIGVVLTIFAGRAALQTMGDSLVSLSYDLPFIVHRADRTDDIRIVYLDEINHNILVRKPQAKLLKAIGDAGARAVIYDVVFDKPSEDPSVDKEFADAIREFRGVDQEGNPLPGVSARHLFLPSLRESSNYAGYSEEKIYRPTPILRKAATGNGLVAWDDENHFIRKLSTGTEDEPSVIWVAAKKLGSALDGQERFVPRWLNYIGPPPDRKNRAGPGPFMSCDAESAMLGGLDPMFFRDKIVVIGGKPEVAGAKLGEDLYFSPFHRVQVGKKVPLMSGVEVQANGLSNLLQGNWLTRSDQKFDFPLIAIAGLLLGVGFTFLRPVLAIFSAGMLVVTVATLGVFSIHFGKFWFPWTVVAFAQVPTALVWGIAAHSYVERFFRIKISAEQEAIRAAFAKYLSPQMLDELAAEGFQTDLGGEQIQAAMMFTDLESFADMCEMVRQPKRIVETLNEYFERTTGSIFNHDGVIIKFIGDAIFAAWGAPRADPEAQIKSVRAAWDLHQRDKLMVDGLELRTRIGLHFGEVVAGNIGSSRRVDYTLIGDAVNLASRLEGINKLFGTSILMSDAIYVHLDGKFRTRHVGKFRVKGRKESVLVYELLGPAHQDTEPEWITKYHLALEAIDDGDNSRALELFCAAKLSRGSRGDGPSEFFIKLLRSGELIRDGVVDLTAK